MGMFIIYLLPGDYAKVEYYSAEKVVVSEKILFIRKNENGLKKAN